MLTVSVSPHAETAETLHAKLRAVGASLVRSRIINAAQGALFGELLRELRRFDRVAPNGDALATPGDASRALDVSIWALKSPEGGNPPTIAGLGPSVQMNGRLTRGTPSLVVTDEREVVAYGHLCFGRECLNSARFTTTNRQLFDFVYLPTQLAEDGDGIFLDERIVDRLTKIGLLAPDDVVQTMVDKGGWKSIDDLVARLDVEVVCDSRTRTEVLLATALAPAPPVRPEELSRAIQQRKSFLRLIGISTSVLDAKDGVVYERRIPQTLSEYLNETSNPNRISLTEQAARITAMLDAGCFDVSNVEIKTGTERGIRDYIEAPTEAAGWRMLAPSFVEVLKTDGTDVFWSNLSRDLALYGKGEDGANLMRLNKVLPCDLLQIASDAYSAQHRECIDPNWLARRLLGD